MDEVVRLINEGCLPLSIELCDAECVTPPPRPPPLYVSLPRTTYLFSVSEMVKAAFQKDVADFGTEPQIWLEYAGVTIPWHFPAGVLCDLAYAQNAKFPLPLVAHVSSTPAPKEVVPVDTKKDKAQLISHRLKSATCIMYGEIKPFVTLHPDDYSVVCNYALLTTSPSLSQRIGFLEVMGKVKDNAGTELAAVAFNVHVDGKTRIIGVPATKVKTFGEALSILQPDLPPTANPDTDATYTNDAFDLLVAGMRPHLATPLVWMMENLCYSDMTVHMVVWQKGKPVTLAAPSKKSKAEKEREKEKDSSSGME